MSNKYEYIIVGGGPTGMTLAWLLENKDRKILLIEKENDLGGCHRVQRVDGYFSEHGPRIYSNSYLTFIHLLTEMEIDFHQLFTLYKDNMSSIDEKNIGKFTFEEKKNLFFAFLKLVFDNNYGKNISLKQFTIDNKFTNESIDYLTRFCRLTDGAKIEDYTLFQFLQIMNQQYFYKIYQPKLPNDKGLIKLWEDVLIKTGNIDILKNTSVLKLNEINNLVESITIRNNNEIQTVYGNKIILAVPPKPLYNIITKSPGFENTFGDNKKLKKWKSNNSYFDYICLTFHYKNKIKLPRKMGFPSTAWGIAYIILSNYMTFENEPSKTVISITLTFPERKNKYGKTVHQCSKNEIVDYVIEELSFFPKPDVVIISPNVVRSGDKWINLDTAYVVTTENKFLDYKSVQHDNLYAVGIFNGNNNYYFTSIEAAVQNAVNFSKREVKNLKYEYPNLKTLDMASLIYNILIIILSIVILVILKYCVFNKNKLNNNK